MAAACQEKGLRPGMVAAVQTFGEPSRITLVDDVITKSVTMIAASRLREVFPEAEIRVFALMRTRSVIRCEGDTALDPFLGWVRYDASDDSANRDDY